MRERQLRYLAWSTEPGTNKNEHYLQHSSFVKFQQDASLGYKLHRSKGFLRRICSLGALGDRWERGHVTIWEFVCCRRRPRRQPPEILKLGILEIWKIRIPKIRKSKKVCVTSAKIWSLSLSLQNSWTLRLKNVRPKYFLSSWRDAVQERLLWNFEGHCRVRRASPSTRCKQTALQEW